MSDQHPPLKASRPMHLWIVGVLSLLWNLVGIYDYLMTQTKNEAYLSKFTPEQLDYFFSFPTWVEASWAIAVWSAVVGSILLLLARRAAVMVFLVSMVAMVLTAIYNYGLSNGMEIMGDPFSIVFTIFIFIVTVFLYLYSRAMAARGFLR